MSEQGISRKAEQAFELDREYRQQRPWLLRLLRRWQGADSDAEDLIQQAFARLASLDSTRTGDIRSPAAFVRRTALNLARDQARATARREALHDVQGDMHEVAASDPLAALEARDILRRIEAVVAQMPDRRREIFLAHRIDGYSYAEIAARTGISVKGVEKHMSKAIAQIDRLMGRP